MNSHLIWFTSFCSMAKTLAIGFVKIRGCLLMRYPEVLVVMQGDNR